VVGAAELSDPKNEFAAAYGIGEGGASLIRPDGFVAWRSTTPADADAAGQLRAVLTRLLMREP
jgi:aklavinone 12-hydroxylase